RRRAGCWLVPDQTGPWQVTLVLRCHGRQRRRPPPQRPCGGGRRPPRFGRVGPPACLPVREGEVIGAPIPLRGRHLRVAPGEEVSRLLDGVEQVALLVLVLLHALRARVAVP